MTAPPPRDSLSPRVPGRGGRDAARRAGAPERGAVPRMEHVRVTSPDLARRAAIGVLHSRLAAGFAGFVLIYLLLAARVVYVTVVHPVPPDKAAIAAQTPSTTVVLPPPARAEITDRNGEILAVSLPAAALYANPKQVEDPGGGGSEGHGGNIPQSL